MFFVILVRSEALLSLFVILNPSAQSLRGVQNLGAGIKSRALAIQRSQKILRLRSLRMTYSGKSF